MLLNYQPRWKSYGPSDDYMELSGRTDDGTKFSAVLKLVTTYGGKYMVSFICSIGQFRVSWGNAPKVMAYSAAKGLVRRKLNEVLKKFGG